jgi:predicted phosphoribosyltransferase
MFSKGFAFEDRKDAGKKLAKALKKYKGKDVLVLAIPRGGVEVGYQVAKYLGAELSIAISRKLPFPDNPESGFGAIAEDGSVFIYEDAKTMIPDWMIDQIMRDQRAEIKRRIDVLRKGEPLPEIKGRTVILVDDGIAMGSTMRATVSLCKNNGAGRIVVAAPVSGKRVAAEMEGVADEVVILEKPPLFQAVAQVYRNWYDVSDMEVIDILGKWCKQKILKGTDFN